MKISVFFFALTSCIYMFASNQVFVVPIIQDNMKVHLLTDHDANHIETNMAIWGPQGHIMSVILANNSVLLSDYLTLSMSSYKLEVDQEMGVVIEYEGLDGDLNLVALRDSPLINGFIVSHMGTTPSWENRFIFGCDVDDGFDITMGDMQKDTIGYQKMATLVYGFHPFHVQKGKGFCTVMSQTKSFYGGAFFDFTRNDGIRGSAAVSPMLYRGGPPGYTTLFLTHIAKDTTHFWTGYSLLNVAGGTAVVGFTAWKNGGIIAYEEVSIHYQEQDIGVIGHDRFAHLSPEDIDWIEITSLVPILGLELFGSPSNQNSYLAGFELPHQQMRSRRLIFPAIAKEEFRWTGLCILNPSPDAAFVAINFIGNQMDDPNTMLAENVVGFTDVTIQRGQKWVVELSTITSPEILARTHSISITSDQGVLGFVLIGDHDRQQLGGYLGIPVPLN